MSSTVNNAPTTKSYLDLSSLAELRGQAQQDQSKALKETAQQFEGMFIQMMLKSMRDANAGFKNQENESGPRETFEGLFDKEVSLQMSKRGALGLGDFLERAVNNQATPATAASFLQSRESARPMPLQPTQLPIPVPSGKAVPMVLEKPAIFKPIKEFMPSFSSSKGEVK